MTEQAASGQPGGQPGGAPFTPADVDFDAVYRGEQAVSGITFDEVPWDIGEPQPELVRLEDSGGIRGEVLDIGCGPGDNAIFLASRGHRVTGADGSETAIGQARGRARAQGVAVEFTVADATSLQNLQQRYDTVLDSALYHCLPEESRTDYAAALHRVTNPGARLHLFCFADQGPAFPVAVSRENLRTHIGAHWNIQDIALTRYLANLDEQGRQQLSELDPDYDPSSLETDEQGRALFAVWHLTAERG